MCKYQKKESEDTNLGKVKAAIMKAEEDTGIPVEYMTEEEIKEALADGE